MRLGLCLPDQASPPRRRASARRPLSSASAIVDLCSPKGWLSDAGSKKDVSRCSCRYGLSGGRCIRPAGAFSSSNAGASSGGPAASPARTRPLVLVTQPLAVERPALGLGVRALAEWAGAFRFGGVRSKAPGMIGTVLKAKELTSKIAKLRSRCQLTISESSFTAARTSLQFTQH